MKRVIIEYNRPSGVVLNALITVRDSFYMQVTEIIMLIKRFIIHKSQIKHEWKIS